jgi:hypothetical protein
MVSVIVGVSSACYWVEQLVLLNSTALREQTYLPVQGISRSLLRKKQFGSIALLSNDVFRR